MQGKYKVGDKVKVTGLVKNIDDVFVIVEGMIEDLEPVSEERIDCYDCNTKDVGLGHECKVSEEKECHHCNATVGIGNDGCCNQCRDLIKEIKDKPEEKEARFLANKLCKEHEYRPTKGIWQDDCSVCQYFKYWKDRPKLGASTKATALPEKLDTEYPVHIKMSEVIFKVNEIIDCLENQNG